MSNKKIIKTLSLYVQSKMRNFHRFFELTLFFFVCYSRPQQHSTQLKENRFWKQTN